MLHLEMHKEDEELKRCHFVQGMRDFYKLHNNLTLMPLFTYINGKY